MVCRAALEAPEVQGAPVTREALGHSLPLGHLVDPVAQAALAGPVALVVKVARLRRNCLHQGGRAAQEARVGLVGLVVQAVRMVHHYGGHLPGREARATVAARRLGRLRPWASLW